MDTGALNALFAISGHLHFEAGEGGLSKAVINNPYASCEIYLHGAHVTSFKPHGHDELLWLSPTAQFDEEKAIRGGIPICWPWFGLQPGKVQHGFARKSLWTLFGTTVNGKGETVLRLGLQDSEASRELFPYRFSAEYSVTIGKSLTLELKTINGGEKAFELSQALHTYFAVDSIDNVAVEGFEGISYIDTLDKNRVCTQEGVITFGEEVDRIYENDRSTSYLLDGKRRVEIVKRGSNSSVVWNPWIKKAASMADFEDEGYKKMLCIETANAASDTRTLEAGECHTISQQITLI